MKEFDHVRLLTNKYIDEGIKYGDIGVILEDYGDGHFEVEFSDYRTGSGFTIVLSSFHQDELEFVDDETANKIMNASKSKEQYDFSKHIIEDNDE
ncbi:MAG: DUF4926 domain-containing protein [Planctomycetaceae bacterium]|jgi:hypothetical protein|nr:DUF4926 domain-containing protein [Planctomycetaceae bacterium]